MERYFYRDENSIRNRWRSHLRPWDKNEDEIIVNTREMNKKLNERKIANSKNIEFLIQNINYMEQKIFMFQEEKRSLDIENSEIETKIKYSQQLLSKKLNNREPDDIRIRYEYIAKPIELLLRKKMD